jgi:putative membrane protein
MVNLLIGWAINAAVLFGLPYLIPAVKIASPTTAIIAALVLGLLNTLVRPILVVLTLPISVITLGLFLLVINGLMFWLAAKFLDGFSVTSFGWAMIAALAYSIITWAVASLLKPKK